MSIRLRNREGRILALWTRPVRLYQAGFGSFHS